MIKIKSQKLLCLLTVLASRVAAETWCTRTIDQSHLSRTQSFNLSSNDKDPLRCTSIPGVGSMEAIFGERIDLGLCQEIELIDNIPIGFDETSAVSCGMIPTSFDSSKEETEKTQFVDFMCYYNILTNEFCGFVVESYSSRHFKCIELDDSEQRWNTQKGYGEYFQTALNKGSCADPFVETVLEQPSPVTNEFINARNQAFNEEAKCPFQTLEVADVNDSQQVYVEGEDCRSSGSGTNCFGPSTYLIQGQELLVYSSKIIAQRQGDQICYSWWQDSLSRCQVTCVDVSDTERVVSFRTYALSAGVGNYNYADTTFKILRESTGLGGITGKVQEDDLVDGEYSSGVVPKILLALIASVAVFVLVAS